MNQANHAAFLGLGNVLLHDEGAGVSVINTLKSGVVFSPAIPLLDVNTLGFFAYQLNSGLL